jgi:6-pyruvoyltetrahydropterin/6-carboxytetrahydropterin synthase
MGPEQSVIARRLLFSCAHFYKQDAFSEAENKRVFGPCFTPHGHGHNYTLEVFVEGKIDADTRLVMNLTELDDCLKHATKTLDHKHLNFDVSEFAKKVPTTENVAIYLRARVLEWLNTHASFVKLTRLRLFETDDLWVEVIG